MEELNKREEKKRAKELKKASKLEEKRRKKVEKKLSKAALLKQEAMEIRKKRYIFEFIVIAIFLIFMLILLCNRTFFRDEYKTSKIDIDIPKLTFFVKDDGNQIVLKTLRKSAYLKDYFESYLSKYPKYDCNGETFYYDGITRTAIYDISVEKNFAMKTIRIDYEHGEINELCTKEG